MTSCFNYILSSCNLPSILSYITCIKHLTDIFLSPKSQYKNKCHQDFLLIEDHIIGIKFSNYMYVSCRYMYNGCMPKKILYENKYQRVSRPVFFIQKCLRHIWYLNRCHWISLLIYLRQCDCEGYQYYNLWWWSDI